MAAEASDNQNANIQPCTLNTKSAFIHVDWQGGTQIH